MSDMNNIELKATRQSLGLSVADAADLLNVSNRALQYWESGQRKVPDNVDITFFALATHYDMVLGWTIDDVRRATIKPPADDSAPQPTVKPKLPLYSSFGDFILKTGCKHKAYWRVYQSVIGHLLLLGELTKLDDDNPIPKDFQIWSWLNGDFELH